MLILSIGDDIGYKRIIGVKYRAYVATYAFDTDVLIRVPLLYKYTRTTIVNDGYITMLIQPRPAHTMDDCLKLHINLFEIFDIDRLRHIHQCAQQLQTNLTQLKDEYVRRAQSYIQQTRMELSDDR